MIITIQISLGSSFFSRKYPHPNLSKNSIENTNPPESRTTNVDLLSILSEIVKRVVCSFAKIKPAV